MLLSTLLHGICDYSGEDMEIKKVTSNVTQLSKGDCFVYLPGVFRDKSYLLHCAAEKRPSVIIGEELPSLPIPCICVKNSREALSRLLYRFYFEKEKPPRLVGVTGTNGKSSVCHILTHLLKKQYKVGFIGTQKIEADGHSLAPDGYTMTTPDPELLYPTLFQMKKMGCEIVVMEASSHALALEKLCPLHFDLSIFTGLGDDHLDFHKTRDEYKSAKEKLFSLSSFAVLNTDCPIGQEYLSRINVPTCTVASMNADCIVGQLAAVSVDGIRFSCRFAESEHQIQLPLPGEHNAWNAAYALCAAQKLGICTQDAIEALAKVPKIKGRLECVAENPRVILDYAHTPNAVESVLRYINATKAPATRTVVVFGAGGDRDRTKRPGMSRIVEELSDFCVITTDNPRNEAQSQIFSDLKKGLRYKNHRFITDRTKAIAYAYKLCQSTDTLVLLGKGHEAYILKNNKQIPYSELYALYLAKKEVQANEDHPVRSHQLT